MTIVVLVLLIAFAALVHRLLSRRRGDTRARVRRSRSRAMLLVIAVVGVWSLTVTPTAAADDCEPPNPERPSSGMVGALDPAEGRGEDGSPYRDYGYAGMVWHVYEMDCGPLPGISNPNTTIDTWLGNQLFNLGKNIVGATNALHYTVMDGGLFAPLNDAIAAGAEIVYDNIYTQAFGLVALLLAIMLFRHIWRGDLPAVSKRVLYALGAVWLAASSFALLRFHEDIDRAIVQTTTNIQAGFVDGAEDRIAHHVLPTALHDEIVYNNWLRGTFGSPDAPQAEEYGMPLLDAQAFTWAELRAGDDADQATVDEKQEEYERIAEELGPATGYFTGEDGSRTGAGFLAFLQSLVYSLFQLFAKAAVLLAQVLVRLLTLTAPLIGLVALLHNETLRKVAKVAGTVAFNLVVLSVLAGVHALLLQAIFAAAPALSMMAQIAIAGLVTILLFIVGKPVRRLWQMVDMSGRTVGGALPAPSGGVFSRFRRRSSGPTQQDHFWGGLRGRGQPDGLEGGAEAGQRWRPEASAPLAATAQRTDVPVHGSASGNGRVEAGRSGAVGDHAGGANAAAEPIQANPARLGYNPAGGIGREPRSNPAQRSGPSARQGGAQDSGSPGGDAARHHTGGIAPRRSHPDGVGAQPAGEHGAVVVPSTVHRDAAAPTGDDAELQPVSRSAPDRPPAGGNPGGHPTRGDAEVVDGRPANVLYRPSRGIEVQQNPDTEPVVR